MADVAINKRTVLVTNPASQQDFPGSTVPPVISPDVDVNFLELVDTPDTYTGQDGKFVRVKSTEDGLEFAAVSGSKWTEVANGIYRDGRVAIGTTTVGTTNILEAVGLSRFRATNTFPQINQYDRTDSNLNIVASFLMNHNRTGGSLDRQGIGIFFYYDDNTANGIASISAIKQGTRVGDVTIATRASGEVIRSAIWVQANKGVYIGARDLNSTSPGVPAESLLVQQSIRTNNFTGTTSRYWKLGERKAGTAALDTTQYITVEVDGVVYNLALATV